ncbi:MAG: radical SAM protein [Gemmatimonadetes bacterium]|nr:radical SAM protein [Gemmatimonadota bacterium]
MSGTTARTRQILRSAWDSPSDVVRRKLTLARHRIHALPVVVLMPHSRCNCRCVMCDIWKANRNKQEISREELARHIEAMRRLRVRWVVLSGGEALMHQNLWALCELIKALPARVTLLSTGLLLPNHAANVVRWCDDVIVSLDGSRAVHDAIRNVPRAYDRLAQGVAAIKALEPGFGVTGRCVVQRRNWFDLSNIIKAARSLGLGQISFLAADVSTSAFNRPEGWGAERVAEVALSREETAQFALLVETTIRDYAADFASGFIAESPEKLRRLPRYFAALNGEDDFPPNVCNAPWVSTVIEADGTVRPCFFHRALGNIHEQPLEAILNSEAARNFRRELDVRADPICRKCVCTLHLSPAARVGPAANGLAAAPAPAGEAAG